MQALVSPTPHQKWNSFGSSLQLPLSLARNENGINATVYGSHHLLSLAISRPCSTVLNALQYQSSISLALYAILIIPILTYWITSARFANAVKKGENQKSPTAVPTLPYAIPLLCHLIPLAWSPVKFVMETLKYHGDSQPMRIKAGLLHFTVVTSPAHIQTVFRSSKQLSSKPGTLFSLRNLLSSPAHVIPHYDADDSGMAAVPRKGSNTAQKDRIHYLQASAVQKLLSGQHLIASSEKFISVLDRNLASTFSSDQWTEFADLYAFLQTTVSRSAIETLMGSKILEMHPDIVRDFWAFDCAIPLFLKCLPRWMIPSAYKARDKLLASIKSWHALANDKSDCSRTSLEDLEWEPYFGSKLLRRRQEYALQTGWMDAGARASEDMGLMFASNGNLLPSIFWYVYEALRDAELRRRLLGEVEPCLVESTGGDGQKVDIVRLSSQPLLQSLYAETLRLRVAIGLTRVSERQDFNLGGYIVPKGQPIVVFTRPAALNEDAWRDAGREGAVEKPLDEFWAERFLVEPNQGEQDCAAGKERKPPKKEFSMEGLAGCWLPYGGGQRMCPGRHLAKNEIIGAFALLFTRYELELLPGAEDVKSDLRWFPIGGLPPVGKVPFRIRRMRNTMPPPGSGETEA